MLLINLQRLLRYRQRNAFCIYEGFLVLLRTADTDSNPLSHHNAQKITAADFFETYGDSFVSGKS
jgi:hypothetical protein